MDDISIRSWEIETRTASNETKDYRESIFSQGNGYMGVRGYSPEAKKKNNAERTTFFSGFFEYIRPGITDMVNQPDFSSARLLFNGLDSNGMPKEEYHQVLDMRDGTQRWSYVAADREARRTKVEIVRFLSMEDIHTAAIRFVITPLNYDGSISLETGIDGNVINLPISDNQLSDNIEFVRMWGKIKTYSEGLRGGLTAETRHSKRRTCMEYHVDLQEAHAISIRPVRGAKYAGVILELPVTKEVSYTVDKLIAVSNYRDGGRVKQSAGKHLDKCIRLGYDGMLQATKNAWNRIWSGCDVELEAPEEIQGAVRYNIFQLIQSDPAKDSHASIGARGLMHGRYKGCYFWDTEVFMLPFYLNTNPEAAKNLLLYRYHTLSDAVAGAGSFSLNGGRYPWMASDTGAEQCETWDTGCCEIHITADIAYALGRYLEQTGDRLFLRDYAAEIYLQTARYWAERFTYDSRKDCYNLLYVKGPDEYCGVTKNDFYTVKLALHNLTLALDSLEVMQEEYPREWEVLKEKIRYQADEAEKWREILRKATLYYDKKRSLWLQDPVFEELEPIDIDACKDEDIPLYHKISYDRLQRYQVLKQPDVLMYAALFPKELTKKQLLAAWDYYEPKTLHDSTLSFGIHALIAARTGKTEEAWNYFYKSLFLDLKNVMKNTAREGIHPAALGASWQALVYGFAGIWADGDGISCRPNLPECISRMRFRICYQGSVYEITAEQNRRPRIVLCGQFNR